MAYPMLSCMFLHLDCHENHKMKGEDFINPSLLYGNADNIAHQVQSDQNQSMVSFSPVTIRIEHSTFHEKES